ncbi:MAG: hypothetical protein OXO51_17525 [Gemmatimonadota bacterium]|nr:hypothetical protein [Gemmatimonadota bacterium]
MILERIKYDELNARQKEIYNFQKVAGLLADFGFNCIKLSDDWQGADFLAYHKDGDHTLRVQLKSGMGIYSKYFGKELHMSFPIDGTWYLIPHDELVGIVSEERPRTFETYSWTRENGFYTWPRPPKNIRARLSEYALSQ